MGWGVDVSEDIRKPAYFAIIPAKVRYDTTLRPNAKLLYAEITALADSTGYCWSSNDYFAKLFDLSPKTVSDLIGTLDKRGYITVEVVRDEATNQVQERRLWVEQRGADEICPPPPKNKGRGGPPKNGDTSPRKCGDPPPKNAEENNTSIINTPLPPKGGVQSDELFERFWKAYPLKKNKDRARRAWKRLNPDLSLCRVMAAALKVQAASEDWARDGGRYIPHASTWLNGKRWEDEMGPKLASGPPPDTPRPPRRSHVEILNGEEVVVFD